MKKWLLSGFVGFFVSLMACSSSHSQVLTVNGSTTPGIIFVGTSTFDSPLLPPITIFFGAGPVPAHPILTTVTQALGNPFNDRGNIWPKENFVVFGASAGFFTTGTAVVLFSSPAPAVDVGPLYSVTPAAGAFVGSVGYGFPGVSPDQPHGTYTAPIRLSALPLAQTVDFSLRWVVEPRFKLLIVPISSGRGNFGSISFGEGAPNQEFVIATQTNEGESYIITMDTEGIINQFGTILEGITIFSDGFSGNALKGVEIPIQTPTPLLPGVPIVIYQSNAFGSSDFFNLGIAIVPPFGQQAGDYSGVIVLTMVTK